MSSLVLLVVFLVPLVDLALGCLATFLVGGLDRLVFFGNSESFPRTSDPDTESSFGLHTLVLLVFVANSVFAAAALLEIMS